MISDRQLFLNHVAQPSGNPVLLEIEKAEGVYIVTRDGKKYTDLISGISVNNLGHRHPSVIKAIKEQSDRYLHTMVYGEHVQAPQVQLAKLLADSLPDCLNNTYFVNSGSEAIEGAMKLARRYTGRTEIIACKNAYHGSTHGALSVMGEESFKRAYRPLVPDVHFIEFNAVKDLDSITATTAAVLVEPIQGEAGIFLPDPEFLTALRKRCTTTGTLLVFDEVQTGFGRTGSLFFFEQYGVIPDVLVLAKGIGGGLPLGAFVSSREIMSVFQTNPELGHITTFGGHPLSTAAGLASLQTILGEGLIESVPAKEAVIREIMNHPKIKEIRGKGLMFAVDLENAEAAKTVMTEALENGVIVDSFIFRTEAIRIAPPLIISIPELEGALKALLKSMDSINY